MKKIVSVIACLLLLAALAAPALADVIWLPEDSFYESHIDECVRVESRYEAQRDTVVQKSPTDSRATGQIAAGEVVYVYFDWNGWGYVEHWDGGAVDGWLDLGAFRRLYDASDFLAEHGAELTDASGVVSREEAPLICLWPYPGARAPWDTLDSAMFDWAEEDPAYDRTWTDADGRVWGEVGYYYGSRGWVCLDAPGDDTLPALAPYYADETDAPGEAAAAPSAESAAPAEPAPGGPDLPVLAIVLVAAVVVLTAAAIVLLTRRKKG